jgi:hypothetical protein
MTLGNAAAARVRLIVWCIDCRHQVEPDPAEVRVAAGRHGGERNRAAIIKQPRRSGAPSRCRRGGRPIIHRRAMPLLHLARGRFARQRTWPAITRGCFERECFCHSAGAHSRGRFGPPALSAHQQRARQYGGCRRRTSLLHWHLSEIDLTRRFETCEHFNITFQNGCYAAASDLPVCARHTRYRKSQEEAADMGWPGDFTWYKLLTDGGSIACPRPYL